MTQNEFTNLVAFIVLMQNGPGIMSKSPDYILERFKRYVGQTGSEFMGGLDAGNRKILLRYMVEWEKHMKFDDERLAVCMSCKRTLPNNLVNAMVTNDSVTDLCAVCALKQRNRAMGIDPNIPFTGTLAQDFYERTLEYYKKTNQL